MCKLGPYIKFCTCGEIQAELPHWVLRRKTSVGGYEDMMGSFGAPSETMLYDNREFLVHKITFDLNNNPVFDFEYAPQDGDAVQIIIDEIDFEVTFTFCYEEWSLEERPLSGGKKLHSGYLEFTAN